MKIILAITQTGIPQLATDLPSVAEAALQHLEKGLPKIGSTLKVGDILVGIVRSTRPLSAGEIEIADLGLWCAGFDDLWENDSLYVTAETSGIVQSVSSRQLIEIPESLDLYPLRYLQFCSQFPIGTILEEIEIEVK